MSAHMLAATSVYRAPWTPDAVWIEASELDSALAHRVRRRLPEVPVILAADRTTAEPPGWPEGKRTLVVQRNRGTFLQHCPAGTSGMVCCNYLIASFGTNCPFDCSYCFLQDYLRNNPAIKAFTNVGDGLAEIDAVLRTHCDRHFRVGTGELADSLALDHLTDLTCELVPFFAERRNAVLELKTKSVGIDNLTGLDPKDRVVVAWSVNTPTTVAEEEDGAPSLPERLAAARRVQAAGYRLGFHLDPLVACDGWEEGYRSTIDLMFRGIDTRRVAWVSLGSLRLTPGLKAAIRARPRRARFLDTELVPGADGKERVWRGLRLKMYRLLLQWLREIDAHMPVYICMEPPAVWQQLFGSAPSDRALANQLTAGLA